MGITENGFNEALIMLKEMREESKQKVVALFKKHGRDYKTDIMLVNVNLAPELKKAVLPDRMQLTDILPDTMAAVFIKELKYAPGALMNLQQSR